MLNINQKNIKVRDLDNLLYYTVIGNKFGRRPKYLSRELVTFNIYTEVYPFKK